MERRVIPKTPKRKEKKTLDSSLPDRRREMNLDLDLEMDLEMNEIKMV